MGTLSDSEIKKILQKKFEDFESEAPPDGKRFLLQELSKNKANSIVFRRTFSYSIIALLALIPILSLYYPKKEESSLINSDSFQSKILPPPNLKEKKDSSYSLKLPPNRKEEINVEINKEPIELNQNVLKPGASYMKNSVKNEKESALGVDADSEKGINKFLAALDSIQLVKESELTNVDSLVISSPEKRFKKRMWLTISAQPFLNYKNLRPNTDGIHLSNFNFPSSLSTKRLGTKIGITLDYEFISYKYLTLGVSYFQYQTAFSYNANETNQMITVINKVNDRIEGVSVSIGVLYPISLGQKQTQYMSFGIDAQKLLTKNYPYSTQSQYMANLGYARHLSIGEKEFRITPFVGYSLTRMNYAGVTSRPYWIGFGVGYAIPIKRN